ncbi:MAG: DedA family protein [Syntrophorhabdales bacterium]|jgi:membrane-associated protein
MDLLHYAFDIILHLDKHLGLVIQQYGFWTHLLLCGIIFCETGLVVTPFLPGDSLLFAAGAFAGLGSLDLTWLVVALPLAAIAGDSSNYWIGCIVGPRVFASEHSRLLNREYLARTHDFYLKYGGKTVIIARFVPIIRTFAPFVAGIGTMAYSRFITYSVAGNICWIMIFTLGGYFFGTIPFVRQNFTVVILAIIVISVLPGVIGYMRERGRKRAVRFTG